MIRFARLLTLIMLCAACTTATPTPADTPEPSGITPTERPTLTRLSTVTPRLIVLPAPTLVPTLTAAPPTLTIPAPTAVLVEQESGASVRIGYSAGGRPLRVQRFGADGATGSRTLLLVGGIHGGWEGNTVRLMEELIEHFTTAPEDVPPGVALLVIPVANPDGYALGRTERGRFNHNGVDLNRNWSCEWSEEARWRQQRVNPGARPFSEPESRALADFITGLRPAGVLFFHSAANGVFAGECGADGFAAQEGRRGSDELAAVFGEAAGYPHDAPFTAYPVTGVASNWVDGQGIPAADVELRSSSETEFERNLRGVLALLELIGVP